METRKYVDHSLSGKLDGFAAKMDMKVLASVAAIELAMFLLAVSRGLGSCYLPTAGAMLAITVIACIVTFYYNADKVITAVVLILLNIGFMVQLIESGKSYASDSALIKMVVTFAAVLIAVLVYLKLRDWLTSTHAIVIMMIAQYVICIMMLVLGQIVGDASEQGARISLQGITPFEFVKLLYIFTAAGLMNKDRNGELILLGHTAGLSMFFVLCSELGTLMVIYITCLVVLWTCGKRRKLIGVFSIGSLAGFSGLWIASAKLMESGADSLPGIALKVVYRFGSALHPEDYMMGSGYQALRGLEALTLGGWFGIETERYRMDLPEAANDFIFDNVVQTCGLIMGMLVILFYIILLKRGMTVSRNCKDKYTGRLTAIIITVITLQAVIHIGYNLAVFPITGLPLYFVSQGYTALLTGMFLITVVQIFSAENCKSEASDGV